MFLWLRDGADSTWLCMGAEGTEIVRGSIIDIAWLRRDPVVLLPLSQLVPQR